MNEPRHLDEETLTGLVLGTLDPRQAREAQEHAHGCARCAEELDALEAALAALTPPPVERARPEVVETTWRAVLDSIDGAEATSGQTAPSGPGRRPWPAAIFGSGSFQLARVAALLVVGFAIAWLVAGQGWLPGIGSLEESSAPGGEPSIEIPAPRRGISRDAARGLLAAQEYPQRLETLLVNLTAGDEAAAPLARGSVLREVSRELLDDSRWYRQVADRSGDRMLSELLGRVEILLLALANVPEGQEAELIAEIRKVIEEDDLLWRLRTVRDSVTTTPRASLTNRPREAM